VLCVSKWGFAIGWVLIKWFMICLCQYATRTCSKTPLKVGEKLGPSSVALMVGQSFDDTSNTNCASAASEAYGAWGCWTGVLTYLLMIILWKWPGKIHEACTSDSCEQVTPMANHKVCLKQNEANRMSPSFVDDLLVVPKVEWYAIAPQGNHIIIQYYTNIHVHI